SDWTSSMAKALNPKGSTYAAFKAAIVAFYTPALGATNAAVEADAIRQLKKTITSACDVTISAVNGTIRELTPEDTAPDIVADAVILLAGNGITGLEVAANVITNADTTRGSISLSDVNGVAEGAI